MRVDRDYWVYDWGYQVATPWFYDWGYQVAARKQMIQVQSKDELYGWHGKASVASGGWCQCWRLTRFTRPEGVHTNPKDPFSAGTRIPPGHPSSNTLWKSPSYSLFRPRVNGLFHARAVIAACSGHVDAKPSFNFSCTNIANWGVHVHNVPPNMIFCTQLTYVGAMMRNVIHPSCAHGGSHPRRSMPKALGLLARLERAARVPSRAQKQTDLAWWVLTALLARC